MIRHDLPSTLLEWHTSLCCSSGCGKVTVPLWHPVLALGVKKYGTFGEPFVLSCVRHATTRFYFNKTPPPHSYSYS